MILSIECHAQVERGFERLRTFEPVQLQGFLRAVQSAYTAADTFIRINHGSAGFLIDREGFQHTTFNAGAAHYAVVTGFGNKV